MVTAVEVKGPNLQSQLEPEYYQTITNLRAELGRPFNATDFLYGEERGLLTDCTEKFIGTYRGQFEFLLDVQSYYRRKRFISENQAKGVANCIVAEWQRVREQEERKKREEIRESGSEVGVETNADGYVIPDGTYTIVRPNGDYHTLRIKTLSNEYCDSKNKERGTRMMKFLNGPDNTSDYKGFAWISPKGTLFVWGTYKTDTRLVEDARDLLGMDRNGLLKTAKAYARKSGRCSICGRDLTNPDSIEAGIGPVCMGRMGF